MILSEALWVLALDRAAAACILPLTTLSLADRVAAVAMIPEHHLEHDTTPQDRANRHLGVIEGLLVDMDLVEGLGEWAVGLEGTSYEDDLWKRK
jgi:hypothetical protein